MKEKIYTIVVNDAFDQDCECPICVLEKDLEQSSLDFFLGPSNMEPDCRLETNQKGFCRRHFEKMYKKDENKLGLALMIETHIEHILAETGNIHKKKPKNKKDHKKMMNKEKSLLSDLENSCALCDRMERIMHKYMEVILHLYFKEGQFNIKVKKSKGFCLKHYTHLLAHASDSLSVKKQQIFMEDFSGLMKENTQRILEDIQWFTQKYDYRNKDAPWKTSKDAVPRAIQKLKSFMG